MFYSVVLQQHLQPVAFCNLASIPSMEHFEIYKLHLKWLISLRSKPPLFCHFSMLQYKYYKFD